MEGIHHSKMQVLHWYCMWPKGKNMVSALRKLMLEINVCECVCVCESVWKMFWGLEIQTQESYC